MCISVMCVIICLISDTNNLRIEKNIQVIFSHYFRHVYLFFFYSKTKFLIFYIFIRRILNILIKYLLLFAYDYGSGKSQSKCFNTEKIKEHIYQNLLHYGNF